MSILNVQWPRILLLLGNTSYSLENYSFIHLACLNLIATEIYGLLHGGKTPETTNKQKTCWMDYGSMIQCLVVLHFSSKLYRVHIFGMPLFRLHSTCSVFIEIHPHSIKQNKYANRFWIVRDRQYTSKK